MNIDRLTKYADVCLASAPDRAPAKNEMRQIVIMYRILAREALNGWQDFVHRARLAEREDKKAKANGMVFPYFTTFAEELRNKAERIHEIVVECGRTLTRALDHWQAAGATFAELCDLCCVAEERGRKIVGNEVGEKFSTIIFVYALDYKGTGDCLDTAVDAPLTHAVKEYILHIALHTEEGRHAGDRAFWQAFRGAFPKLWDNRLCGCTDEDGGSFFTDGGPANIEEDET